MLLKTRRAINFWWAFGTVILVAILVVGSYFLFHKQKWFTYFIVSVILSFALFWGFYLAYTCFQKNKYPYLTYVPEYSATSARIKNVLTIKFIWIYLLPFIAAIACPVIFIAVHALSDSATFHWQAVTAYIICLATILINNLTYSITMSRLMTRQRETSDFTLRKD